MSVTSQCEICTTGDVDHTCNRCAMLVCDRHYDEDTGYCVECAAEVGKPSDGTVPDDDDLPEDVDTYEF
ncbi:hypothetical protein BRC65_07175 [Halobacteriales archaeon QH_2_65_14]|nr:MAG: hypothetical protein BRC65_07175 [Halobacteriales archaeon QH_2_65_14]